MPITNGTVKLLRRVRTGDFEHIEPDVTMSYTVEGNEDPAKLAGYVVSLVDTQYKLLLAGLGQPAATLIPADHPAAAAEPEKATSRRSRKPAETSTDPLSQAGGAASTVAETATASASDPLAGTATGPVLNAAGKPVADPLAGVASAPTVAQEPAQGVTDPLAGAGTPTASTQTSPSAAPSGQVAGTTDPLANSGGGTTPPATANGTATGVSAVATNGTAAPELSNADLSKVIFGTMQSLSLAYNNDVAAARIGETIRSYAPEAAQIPVDKRVEFVEKLRALA